MYSKIGKKLLDLWAIVLTIEGKTRGCILISIICNLKDQCVTGRLEMFYFI